ncbi:hypothetical protein [Zunongwangia sp. HGR-M22]|uniref:hypothetical protein n=1 Tax=Zunongwangia sp. HGR-M22 TaxID=3015168 RepID=UPI0022DE9090|nr:hypothetical protein [Zunongwangia sp. HGR-M22]WBL25183.1 hypothetical protein PBT91_14925 [Zunongwangia sp. HGR-M22]
MKRLVILPFSLIFFSLNTQNIVENYPDVEELVKALYKKDSLQSGILENEEFLNN